MDMVPSVMTGKHITAKLVEKAGLEAVKGSETYSRYAADYFEYVRTHGRYVADVYTLEAWKKEKLKDHSPASLVPMLAGVKKALRGAAKELTSAREAAAFSEALRDVKAPKKATGKVRRSFILSPSEEKAALAIMTPRDAALFRFLMATGTRISEALAVKKTDCIADGTMIRVPVFGKGEKAREVRITAGLFADILEAYSGETWLFETSGGKPVLRDYAYRRISQAVLQATGKHFSPHGCRHSFATRGIERTGKVKAVSEYLGHSGVGVTLDMYVHQDLSDEELAEIS